MWVELLCECVSICLQQRERGKSRNSVSTSVTPPLEVLLIDVALREVRIGVVVRGRNTAGFVSFLGVGGGIWCCSGEPGFRCNFVLVVGKFACRVTLCGCLEQD